MQKNGTHPKTNNLNFGHVYKHNKTKIINPKTQISYYHLSLENINIARLIDYCKMLSH